MLGCRGQPSLTAVNREGILSTGGPGRMPCFLTALIATRLDINITQGDQRPPYKPLDFPHCYASDFNVLRSQRETLRTEFSPVWEGSE